MNGALHPVLGVSLPRPAEASSTQVIQGNWTELPPADRDLVLLAFGQTQEALSRRPTAGAATTTPRAVLTAASRPERSPQACTCRPMAT